MVDWGKAAGGAGAGAAAGSVLGPWGTAGGAIIGGALGLLSGDGNNAAPQAPPAQFAAGNGADLTNQLAALQYSEGLTQQQAQNAREAGFYNNANGNFDIANAAQLRAGPQVAASAADQQRQLAALGATNAAGGRLNSTGDLLTKMGTAPMGPSYAEAQLRQGQSDAMAQQLAMARSGRSLGSGQAAMGQAAFNNAALNQSTNQAAAAARIQEQQNYNQFQLGALQGAGNAYSGAGALAGQAGNQATTVRAGNEGLQAQNAALQQSQQQINNQTSGLYNQLGAQQQQLGMQANTAGQNAYQFGAQQGQNAQIAQLNANLGQTAATTQTNIANMNNANAHDAANMNMAAAGFGAAADAVANPAGGSAPVNANNPSGSTSPYANITKASNSAGPITSDERQKTNIKALGGDRITPSSAPTGKYDDFSPKDADALRAADEAAVAGTAQFGRTMDDESMGRQAVTGEAPSGPPPGMVNAPSYGQVIGALNQGYRASQFAPADVLNRVPGAGAGPSASQQAVMAAMQRAPRSVSGFGGGTVSVADANAGIRGTLTRAPADTPMSGAATSMLNRPAATPIRSIGAQASPFMPAHAAAPPAAWGDVFNAPQFDPAIAGYLSGNPIYRPPNGPAPGAAPSSAPFSTQPGSPGTGIAEDGSTTYGMLSDVRSKTRIRELETQLAALSAPPTASFAPQAPDTAALDAAYAREQQEPGVDFRNAHGYEYEYKDPRAPGAAPGKQVGTMAQELEQTSAAPYVHDTPRGKQVDTNRLPLALAPAIGETQRRVDDLEAQLNALQGSGLPAYGARSPAWFTPGAAR